MRKVLLVLVALMFIAGSAHSAIGPIKVSANTVAIQSDSVVTFNTIVSKVFVQNMDTVTSIHVTFDGLGWKNNTGQYIRPTMQSFSTVGAWILAPGSSISLDINTDKIGFYSGAVSSVNTSYLVSTENLTQP